MKPNWNKPWDSEDGELGRLASPFKKIGKKIVKEVKKTKKKARGKK